MSQTVKVTVEGQVFTTDDLTLSEADAIDKAVGEKWAYTRPLASPSVAIAVFEAFLARTHGREKAREVADTLTVREAFDAFEVVDDDLPDVMQDGLPKAEADPTTPG